jgi:hypothetical protein
MFQISPYRVLGDLGPAAGAPREGHQPNHQADPAAAQPLEVVPHLVPDDGELGHRGAQQALLEAGVAAEQKPEHGDHHQQQGKEREERVVGDHRGQRTAVVVTELPHDREGEAQPPGTLLHTVNRPQQPSTSFIQPPHRHRLAVPHEVIVSAAPRRVSGAGRPTPP